MKIFFYPFGIRTIRPSPPYSGTLPHFGTVNGSSTRTKGHQSHPCKYWGFQENIGKGRKSKKNENSCEIQRSRRDFKKLGKLGEKSPKIAKKINKIY